MSLLEEHATAASGLCGDPLRPDASGSYAARKGSTDQRFNIAALPPGPTSPPLVQFARSRLHPLRFFDECASSFGECFTWRFPGNRIFVVFTNPEALREIMNGDPRIFQGGEANRQIKGIMGPNSLFVLDAESHLAQRRLMLPAFHSERMQTYCGIMREVCDKRIRTWRTGNPFRLLDEMKKLVLETLMRAIFGVDAEAVADLTPKFTNIMALTDGTLAAWRLIPLLQRGRFGRAIVRKNELLSTYIRRRRERGTAGREDIMSMLIEARDESGNVLNDDELRDQLFALLVAGYETTTASLAWDFYQVLSRPEVLEKCQAEIKQVVGEGMLRADHVAKLEYLDAVIKETSRLNTVVPLAGGRRLRANVQVAGRNLPAGVHVVGCVYLTHRRADLWDSPEEFRPERFIGPRPAPYSFLPFGAGDRRCIGAALATFEQKVVLAEVLSRTQLRIAEGYKPRPVKKIVAIAPSAGMPVRLERKFHTSGNIE